jgi:hypothetical protein
VAGNDSIKDQVVSGFGRGLRCATWRTYCIISLWTDFHRLIYFGITCSIYAAAFHGSSAASIAHIGYTRVTASDSRKGIIFLTITCWSPSLPFTGG